jgi:hypothetical protein
MTENLEIEKLHIISNLEFNETYKKELEERIGELTAVYKNFLENLDNILEKKEENEEEIKNLIDVNKKLDNDLKSMLLLNDCVKGRLDELRKDLKDIYNNKYVDRKPRFEYSRIQNMEFAEKFEPQ